jgi:cell division protein FtsQ
LLGSVKFLNRLAYLVSIISLLIIAGSITLYAMQNWFTINKIIVEGDTNHISHKQLDGITHLRGSFFTLDISGLRQEFFKIPWVKEVAVERQFPDIIIVRLKEYQAAAYWGGDGSLLSMDGRIFVGGDDVSLMGLGGRKLPTFYAASNQIEELLARYSLILPLLEKNRLILERFDYLGVGLSKIYLTNGLQVVICGSDVVERINLLAGYLPELYKINPKLNYINMCYKNALAINAPIGNSRGIKSK